MFKLIKNSGLTENEVRLVQTDIDYSQKEKLVESAKAGLMKYFGRMKESKVDNTQKAFALNEGNDGGDQEALFGSHRDRSGTYPGRGNGGGRGNFGNGNGNNFRGGFKKDRKKFSLVNLQMIMW